MAILRRNQPHSQSARGTSTELGWPCYEGASRQGAFRAAGLTLCETLYATANAVVLPHYRYLKGHNVSAGEASPSAGASITGVAFYAGGRYPSRFNGALFFADYTRRCIWVMTAGVGGLPDPATRAPFVTAAAYPVDLAGGIQDGDLFYVDFTGGTVHRIAYSAQNTPPRAAALGRTCVRPCAADRAVRRDSVVGCGGRYTGTFNWDLTGDGVFGDSALGRPTLPRTGPTGREP